MIEWLALALSLLGLGFGWAGYRTVRRMRRLFAPMLAELDALRALEAAVLRNDTAALAWAFDALRALRYPVGAPVVYLDEQERDEAAARFRAGTFAGILSGLRKKT